jgi:hypothetical protein
MTEARKTPSSGLFAPFFIMQVKCAPSQAQHIIRPIPDNYILRPQFAEVAQFLPGLLIGYRKLLRLKRKQIHAVV